MSEKNFDYISTAKKILQDNNLLAECFEKEHSATFETGTTKMKNFRVSFKMTVSEDGWLITCCPMAGKVPKRILTDFLTEMLTKMERLSSLKLFVDNAGMLMASYETLLADSPELIESDIFNSMSVLDMAYAECIPKLMLLYWSAMEEDNENR